MAVALVDHYDSRCQLQHRCKREGRPQWDLPFASNPADLQAEALPSIADRA